MKGGSTSLKASVSPNCSENSLWLNSNNVSDHITQKYGIKLAKKLTIWADSYSGNLCLLNRIYYGY
jgi:hypothetical protein